jgi:hypothetical protein
MIRRKAEDARDTFVETSEHIMDRVADTSDTILDASRGVYRKASATASGAGAAFDKARRAAGR